MRTSVVSEVCAGGTSTHRCRRVQRDGVGRVVEREWRLRRSSRVGVRACRADAHRRGVGRRLRTVDGRLRRPGYRRDVESRAGGDRPRHGALVHPGDGVAPGTEILAVTVDNPSTDCTTTAKRAPCCSWRSAPLPGEHSTPLITLPRPHPPAGGRADSALVSLTARFRSTAAIRSSRSGSRPPCPHMSGRRRRQFPAARTMPRLPAPARSAPGRNRSDTRGSSLAAAFTANASLSPKDAVAGQR